MEMAFEQQTLLRILFSVGGLFLFWGLAFCFPFRNSEPLKNKQRWLTNLLFNFGNGFLVYLLIPFTLIELSQSRSFSELALIDLNQLPTGFGLVLGVLILDLAIYWQHRLSHSWKWFWRLHRMHHSDIEIDTTTAGRFHTLEIFISFVFKALIVVSLGIPALAILIFEILLNFSSLFNHSNFSLPSKLEKLIRWILITPDVHRIHHSTRPNEMHRNFGFSISTWDYIFGSFKAVSKDNPQTMDVGLKQFREQEDQSLLKLFLQPFK